MMNNISERDRRTLKMGGIGVAGILIFMVVISPLMDQWNAETAKIEKDQATLKSVSQGLSDAVTARQKLEDLQQLARVNMDVASVSQQTAQMLHQVEGLPTFHNLQVGRIEGTPLRSEDRFYRSSVSLQFSGSLGNLHRFLQDVEKQKPVLRVERLSLTTNAKDPSRLEGQMVISGYAVVLTKRTNG